MASSVFGRVRVADELLGTEEAFALQALHTPTEDTVKAITGI